MSGLEADRPNALFAEFVMPSGFRSNLGHTDMTRAFGHEAVYAVDKHSLTLDFSNVGHRLIEELVAAELRAAMVTTRAVDDPWGRLAGWISARRDLRYREPAFTDVMAGSHAETPMVAELAAQAAAVTDAVVDAARAGGVLHCEMTAGDIFWADVANGLALRVLRTPRRADYERRTRHFIHGLRPR